MKELGFTTIPTVNERRDVLQATQIPVRRYLAKPLDVGRPHGYSWIEALGDGCDR
jgi:hypothetical protein